MGAPLGNTNAAGHRSGGRKSFYKEKADAEFLKEIWEGKYSRAQLERITGVVNNERDNNKKYGVKHILAAKAMTGDMKAVTKLMDKLFANKTEMDIKTNLDRDDSMTTEERDAFYSTLAKRNEPTDE